MQRKRVIKIFRDLIIVNPSFQGRTAVFTKLLQQAANRKEDDGVRDLIHETFQMLWFSARSNNTKRVEQPNGAWNDLQKGPYDTARQMLDILTVSPKSSEYLAALGKEMLIRAYVDADFAGEKNLCRLKLTRPFILLCD